MSVGCRATLSAQVLDEIALEGLEGITLDLLWQYIGKYLQNIPLPDHFKSEIWQFIKRNGDNLQFFELPVERPTFSIFNRFETVDDEFGVPIFKDPSTLHRYKYSPIQDNEILGSCEHYKERKKISFAQIKEKSLEEVQKTYNNKLVIVASQDMRFNALVPPSALICKDIKVQHYCVLEAIGRSRTNGETPQGKFSLQDFCKDASLFFYIKTKLLKMGLIVTQNYTDIRNDRLTFTTLIRLPRFYVAYQSVFTTVIETVFLALKETPDNTMSLVKLRNLFFSHTKKSSWKKIILIHQFRRIFDVKSVSLSAKSPKSPTDGKSNTKGRTILVVSLRDPNMSLSEIFVEKGEDDDPENDEADSSLASKLTYVDMLLKDQIYHVILRHGARGVSQSELCAYIGICRLTSRQVIKHLLEENLIKSYVKDVGRQRLSMYVALEFAKNIANFKASIAELKSIKCSEIPKITERSEKFLDINEISSKVRHFRFDLKMTREWSNRQVARAMIVINSINENCLLNVQDVFKNILEKEKEQGYKDLACRKSVRRILNTLVDEGSILMYEVILKYEKTGSIRIHCFVSHPKINIDHDVLKHEVLRLKHTFFIRLEEVRLKNESQINYSKQKQRKLEENKLNSPKKDDRKNSIKEIIHKTPKFLVSRYVHEFLFYIIVELNGSQRPLDITEELLKHWKESEPSLLSKEYMEMVGREDSFVKAYMRDISWRTFIPPLPTYAEKPAGWAYLVDIMDRLPLSIFMKIFRLDTGSNETLEKYASHPIRKHYLVRQLPIDLTSVINHVFMQRVIITVLRLLNHMGLVQVSEQVNLKDKFMTWIFLNRRAKIVDTTPSEAGYSRVSAERTYETINYEFTAFEDVLHYWMNMQRICVYTKLGFKTKRDMISEAPQRVKELVFLDSVGFDEAVSKDVGYIPGDGCGAGGLCTKLFAHNFRYWSWALLSSSKPAKNCVSVSRRVNKDTKNKILKFKKTSGKMMPISLIKRSIPTKIDSKVTSSKQKYKANRDAIDREALNNMRTLRVTWTPEEDKILKMAKAVYVYISPPLTGLQLIKVAKLCRDIIRQLLDIRNKTTQACLRRFHFIVKTNRHLPETPTWVHLLQTNEQINLKYGNEFVKKLKLLYSKRNEFMDAIYLHFIVIFSGLYKLINNISTVAGPTFSIPNTMTDFERLYHSRARDAADELIIKHDNPRTDFDLKVSVVYGLLHSSMCCTRDKTVYTLQAFEIFKYFSEDVLNTAFEKARTDGLVVGLKRKYMQIRLEHFQLTGPSYLLSSKYRLRLSLCKIPYVIFEAFFRSLTKAIDTLYPSNVSNSTEVSSYDFKSPHIGQLLLLTEGLSRNLWLVTAHLPANILAIDTDQPVSFADRVLHNFHSILDNAPQIEYTKNFSSDVTEKRSRVKFYPGNLSYKMYYSPYDLISKISNRFLHFFCALDAIQQNFEININEIRTRSDNDDTVECPFNCVMKSSEYLESIQQIVQENKEILDMLVEPPAQKSTNLTLLANSVKVESTNVLTITSALEAIWREKEKLANLKDFGKLPIDLKCKKPIDWKKLCQDILQYNLNEDDFDRNDEYEPTLSKEDRIRDAFAINLPTIKVSSSAALRSNKKIQHGNYLIPELLMPLEKKREEILEKVKNDSLYEYTEETFESLKPQWAKHKLTTMEFKHLEAIHNYIANQKFGVSLKQLLIEFPYKNFLYRALHLLIEKYLIKRVGVSIHIYVHKNHLRDWVVHTFHITRRDQENLRSSVNTKKRKSKSDPGDEGSTSNARKRARTENDNQGLNSCTDATVEGQPQDGVDKSGESELTKERKIVVLRPRPWIRLNGSINRRVLDRWLGAILTECMARFGGGVNDVCQYFKHMFPADLHFLLEILSDLQCVSLVQTKMEQVDLFSEYKDLEEVVVDEIVEPENTYIKVHTDAVMRMTSFIGNKKYGIDFV